MKNYIWMAVIFLLGLSATGKEMQYNELCDAQGQCRKFSRLVMGTDHLAQSDWTRPGQPAPTEEEIFSVLDEAARLGINFFDTAPIYVGGIEYTLGKWMRLRKETVRSDGFYSSPHLNPDRRLYALSKGGFPFDLFYSKKLEQGEHSARLKEELVRLGILDRDAIPTSDGSIALKSVPPGTYASRLYGSQSLIEQRVSVELGHSVANLGENLAIYLMHRDDADFIRFDEISRPQTPVQTVMRALSAPLIRDHYWMLGWSNWRTPRVNESIRLSIEDPKLSRPGFNSPYFSLFEMSSRSIHAGGVQVTHDEMMDPEFQKGVKIMPYSPLGGFSFLDQPEPRWENAQKAAKLKYDQGDPYWQNVFHALFTDENRARYERVTEFTRKFNQEHSTVFTLDQMVNAYALAHPRTDFLAVGAVTVEQIRRTVDSLKLAEMLTVADLEFLYSGKGSTQCRRIVSP